ncbi:MAG: flagellar filament capping protein FliD [candidate division Zixibacteria bacterium]|nr:flagellar filament capping protein FliD [candidate division Zixibacteria bacterium]
MPGATIDGLNSGINTTELVDSIISFERNNAVLLENEQSLKTSIISALTALQAKFIALGTQLNLLRKTATFEAYSVDISDEGYLSATTSGRVGTGSYDIQVLSLARNHQLASQGFASPNTATFGTGSITIKVGDGSEGTVVIDQTNNSLEGIRKAINDARLGVTASIINDGSASSAYRLILSSDNTGLKNRISVNPVLTGGETLNFATGSFDAPEMTVKDLASTSRISLGPTATYSGSQNKIYTFTVRGEGTQTIGDGNILIDWTDGANSGTVAVTQADMEVLLVDDPQTGEGADGLTLSFNAGTLTAGDTFQVAAFSPLLQEASDAKIALGSTGGAGSPITVTSASNTFENLISGLSLTVRKETEPGSSISISTGLDLSAVKEGISTFIERYNEVQSFIDEQNTYNSDSEESGLLFGDYTVISMQSSLRIALGSMVGGITSKYNQLATIGVRTDADGKLSIKDSAALERALKENLDDVIRLFTTSGDSSTNAISFVSASDQVASGQTYRVDITRAATHGGFGGTAISDPAGAALTLDGTNNRLKLVVDGLVSNEIILTEGTYHSTTDLINEIQAKIDADDKIGNREVKVAWVDDGNGEGHIRLTSNTYGEASYVRTVADISNAAYLSLGLLQGTSVKGQNVQGTINGEAAEGQGQFLTGKEGNATTSGLKLKITLDESQVIAGSEGSVTVTKGVASRLGDIVDSLTRAGEGTFDRRIGSYKNQVELIKERIKDIDARLAIRRESLLKKFYEMEIALGNFSAQSQYLNSQLASLNNNWKFNIDKS